ncbi:MAG: hypothetical protein JST39_14435 [Bacteroidetes bacterium]|nr:hypothetical protein [Bacteroidota bacterium]
MTRDVMASGDSREVMIDYYSGKILQLKEELNDLTILQHPIQIQTLCSKIMAIKTIISDMRPMALRPSVLLS